MVKNLIHKFGLFCLVFLMIACSDTKPKVTAEMRIMIDTITQNKFNAMVPELNKKCEEKAEESIKMLADSLVTIRMQQIQEKLNNANNSL